MGGRRSGRCSGSARFPARPRTRIANHGGCPPTGLPITRNDPPTVPTVEKARVGAPGLAGDGVRNAWDTVPHAETGHGAAGSCRQPSGGDDEDYSPSPAPPPSANERIIMATPAVSPLGTITCCFRCRRCRTRPDDITQIKPFGDTRESQSLDVRMGPSALVIIAPLIWGNGCRAIEPARFLRGFFDDVGLFGDTDTDGHAVLRRRAFAEFGDHCRGHLFLVSSRRAAAAAAILKVPQSRGFRSLIRFFGQRGDWAGS